MNDMSLAQARLMLVRHKDNLNQIKGELEAMDTTVKTFLQVFRGRIRHMEGMIRDNSRDLQLIVGSHISPRDIVSMREMYAVALENSDRISSTILGITPVSDHTRNVRANLSVINAAIDRNIA